MAKHLDKATVEAFDILSSEAKGTSTQYYTH